MAPGSARRRLGVGLLAIVVGGSCTGAGVPGSPDGTAGSPPPPPPNFELLNPRVIFRASSPLLDPAPALVSRSTPAPVEPDGAPGAAHPGAPVFGFDDVDLPIVRVPREQAAGLEVHLSAGGWRERAEVDPVARGDTTLLRVRRSGPGLEGPGEVELVRGGAKVTSWAVRWVRTGGAIPELRRTTALRKARDLAGARSALAPALTSTSAWVRLWAEIERGNIEFKAGERPEARRAWVSAATTADALGVPSQAASRWITVAFLDSDAGQYRDAAQALARAEEHARDAGDERELGAASYHAGLLARRLGEHVRAERLLRRAIEVARRSGDDPGAEVALAVLALELMDVGRFHEALGALSEVQSERLSGPARASFLANRSWVTLAAMVAGAIPTDLSSPRRDYQEALDIYLREAGTPQSIVNAKVRLAHIALLEGDLPRARALLHDVDGAPEQHLGAARFAARLTRASLAISEGDLPAAERLLSEVERRIRRESGDGPTEDLCTAQVMLGDVHAQLGRRRRALAAYEAAFRGVAELARRIEVPRSRGRYMFRRAALPGAYASALLGAGRAAEAWWVLDREASITLDDVEANLLVQRHPERWREYRELRARHEARAAEGCEGVAPSVRAACLDELSASEARAAAALDEFYALGERRAARNLDAAAWLDGLIGVLDRGDVLLAIYRLGEEWVTFVLADGALSIERGTTPPERALGRARGAAHVYLVLGHRTESFDPLEVGDEPLLFTVPATLLPTAALLLEPAAAPAGAPLFIADPDGTMPAVRRVAHVRAEQMHAELLEGPRATRSSVLETWSGRRLVHFAGHGRIAPGTTSAAELELAGGEVLKLEDLLTARASIALVVLEGCGTGHREREGELGAPHALLASGARSVLASLRALTPGEGTAFLDAFYRHGALERPAEAFRQAARELRSDPVVRALRLWGRK